MEAKQVTDGRPEVLASGNGANAATSTPEGPQKSPQQPRPPHHPAIHQEPGFAAVGVLNIAKKSKIVTLEDNRVTVHDVGPDSKYREDHIVPDQPIYYPDLAGRWPGFDWDSFKAAPTAPTWAEMVSSVRAKLVETVDFRFPEDATLAAIWTVGTWFYRLSPSYPRLDVNGEMESGKSRVLKNVAAMSFNGMFLINPSVASLFRLIDSHRPTLCIDEAENLSKDDKGSLVTIYNAGYQSGASVPRVEGESGARRVEGYDVYAPLAVAGIAGVGRVAASRSVTITMLRSTDRAMVNRELDPKNETFAPIRAGLYRALLVRHQEFREARPAVPEFLVGRSHECFVPLLKIASLAGPEFEADIRRVARRSVLAYDGLSPELRALLFVLEGLLVYHDEITVYPGGDSGLNVAMGRELDMKEGEKPEARAVGQLLKRVGFDALKHTNRGWPYRVTRKTFVDVAKRNGYPFEDFPPIEPIPDGSSLKVMV